MDIKFWMSTLIGTALAIGSVQAFAGNGWEYDEDSDTIIFSSDESPASQSTSHPYHEDEDQSGAWYYEESSDSIVFKGEGSRVSYAHSNPSNEGSENSYQLAFLDQ